MSLICSKCQQENRDIARYCKHCGARIAVADSSLPDASLDELIGLADLKKAIQNTVTFATRLQQSGRTFDKSTLHTILIGNTGTAKSRIPDILARIYYKNGIIAKPDVKVVNAASFESFFQDVPGNLNAARGGVIFIDEVNKLLPEKYIPGQTTMMDKLFAEMDGIHGDPVIILSSRPEGFKDYLNDNPKVRNRFGFIFELPDLSAVEMGELAQRLFARQKFSLSPVAKLKMEKLWRKTEREKDGTFGNGYTVQKIVDDIIEAHFLGLHYQDFPDVIQDYDIAGNFNEDKTTAQIFAELDDFVGMTDIKRYIRNLVERIKVSKRDAERTGKKYFFGEHLIFTGNPGTGKTTLARKLGEIFASIGLLDRGHVVEADRSTMVAQYVGQTAKQVQKLCDQAQGGILFIDEAYTLKQHDNDIFGQEAIDTVLKRMEDDRGKFMVIAAGYEKEMQDFITSNPGLKSRFKEENIFNLPDYDAKELFDIFQIFAKKGGYELNAEAAEKLQKVLLEMYDHRDKNFGNGRTVRNLYEQCLARRAARLQNAPDDEYDLILRPEDVPGEEDKKVLSVDEALAALNRLIGLDAVKKEIAGLVDYLEVEKIRAASGGKSTSLNLHFIFKGNPGTGKTTVARILADIFKAMGLLSRGQLIETDRKDLVGRYVGETAPKTNKVIDRAMGGMLFIDEAYSLTPLDTGQDFGQEAVNTLLKRMEDDSGKFIVVAAGYDNEMQRFLDSNPGLSSRFSKHIHFEDYEPQELTDIFKLMVKSKGMTLASDMDTFLLHQFTGIYDNRDKNFANGRTVRNLFEAALQNQAVRIANLHKAGQDVKPVINVITKEDVSPS
jgi:SpoVK/Ycf46/Vps4 family AAA+-type ATPase